MDTTEGTSLDDLLNDAPQAEETEAGHVEPPSEPEDTGQPRDEHGRFAAKTGVDPETDTVPPTDKLPQEDYKAVREEREKRQALERELEALRQQHQALKEPPAPPPSMWEDERGWQQHFGNEVVTTAVQQATLNAKLDMSEMMVRQANPDFDEVKAEFLALAEQNPQLVQQALADPHPWNKAYQIAKNHKTMAELGATNLDDLKTKLREEIMVELQQGSTPVPQARPQVPPSLTTERTVGGRGGPAWAGPKPLSELLG